MKTVTVKWVKHESYESASDSTECIYLFVSKGKPNYIGICNKSVFGGSKREVKNRVRSPRYGSSYSHLINGFIAEGGELYIGKCSSVPPENIKSVESSLINVKKPKHNKQILRPKFKVKNTGDVPNYLNC